MRGAILLSASIAALAIVPAVALGWRPPTRFERGQIRAAASRVSHGGGQSVHVSQIRISSVGPWASATVTIYFNGAPDNATDILHFKRGRWRNASVGTSGEWCVMPKADRQSLGFPADYSCE